MTLAALDVNDLYVAERMLAASYGVIMANQRPQSAEFQAAYRKYLRGLGGAVRGATATRPTSHWLMRAYAQGSWDMAAALYPDVAAAAATEWEPAFATTKGPRSYSETSRRGEEVQHAFGMDFENYTVGALYENRSNYDRRHTEYRGASPDPRPDLAAGVAQGPV